MPNPECYNGPLKLVMAFDIGTTCSGVSYCVLQPGQILEILGVTRFPGQGSGRGDAKIPSLLYYDWNGTVKAVGAEALDENIGEDTPRTNGWTRVEWWKLHLRPSHMASKENHALPPLPLGKSAVEILSDFIRYMFQCAKTYIVEHHLAFPWSTVENSIEFIFTHPNGWEGLQQQQYREAIGRAGLIPYAQDRHARVHMLTEGEASLHYCVSSILHGDNQPNRQGTVMSGAGSETSDLFGMDDQPNRPGTVLFGAGNETLDPFRGGNQFNRRGASVFGAGNKTLDHFPGDQVNRRGTVVFGSDNESWNPLRVDEQLGRRGTTLFGANSLDESGPRGVVVIDAGGGTIDLSMYSMTFNPVSCKEVAPAECRLQGSVFVTRRAEALLQRKLEGWEGLRDKSIPEITRVFDTSTKLTIKNDREPAYIRVAGLRYSNPKYNISFGKLKLTGEEVTGLFDDSVKAIIDAFEQQLKHATIPITMAFLVGGFSSNDWVWSQLQLYFENRNIQIHRLESQANKAAAHGAALAYADPENHLVTARVARATYGFFFSTSASKRDEQHVRRRSKWQLHADGYYVPGCFESKLLKGARVLEEMEFRETLCCTGRSLTDLHKLEADLGCYRGNLSDPKWVDEDESSFSTLCTISANVGQAVNDLAKNHGFYYQIDYEVILFFGLAELQAQVACQTRNGERRFPATVSYQVPYSKFSSFTNTEF